MSCTPCTRLCAPHAHGLPQLAAFPGRHGTRRRLDQRVRFDGPDCRDDVHQLGYRHHRHQVGQYHHQVRHHLWVRLLHLSDAQFECHSPTLRCQ
jgi:hypothetical protein